MRHLCYTFATFLSYADQARITGKAKTGDTGDDAAGDLADCRTLRGDERAGFRIVCAGGGANEE